MKIGLLGYGSLGKQVHYLLKEKEGMDDSRITVFDDVLQPSNEHKFTLKPFHAIFNIEHAETAIYICLGYSHLEIKHQLIEKLIALNYNLPNLIHPLAGISKYAQIGKANIFFSGVTVDAFSLIGNGNIFYNQACITHDVKIDHCNFFAPAVVICGNAEIGNTNFIGAKTAIANGVVLGDNNKIGIGSVITQNISSHKSGIGNPFKILKQGISVK